MLQLIARLGFDGVDAGPLAAGLALGPYGQAFGLGAGAEELSSRLLPVASSTNRQ